ncbi:MAG: hypothetical protein ACE5G0_00520 [Rhodothermales bacterium]
MLPRPLLLGRVHARVRPVGRWLLLALLLGLGLAPGDVAAQRPFRINDPFYRGETARRDFFDRYAFTAEVSYRSAGSLQEDGLPTASSDLGLRFRFDYELASRLDLGAIFDAVGGNTGRSVSLSWLVLKYYRYLERSDYAFRLAVDPSSDGRVGFPQVDLAFLYTSLLSPVFSTDFGLGMRRVNIGYAQFLPPEPLGPDDPLVIRPRPTVLFTRALGTELHVMMDYNLLLDPAGSNLFFGFLGEGGAYSLIESPLRRSDSGTLAVSNISDLEEGTAVQEGQERRIPYRGGVVWVRAGIEFHRPSYQISPFLGAPLKQWTPEAENGSWPQARLHFGVQLMLR